MSDTNPDSLRPAAENTVGKAPAAEDPAAEETGTRKARQRGPNLYAWVGPPLVFAGAISYFLFFVRFPALRDFPWLNLPIVFLGLLASAIGLRRAFSDLNGAMMARLLAGLAFVASLGVTLLFTAYIFYMSYQLPDSDGVPQVSQVAPDFLLPGAHGKKHQLSDLRGTKVVIDFYRGHW